MEKFYVYNQINILPTDQHKIMFICPLGTFPHPKLPFSINNVGDTSQRAMSYTFHDIKHIVQPYLDYLPTHSMKREYHPIHLKAIFIRCQHYNIHLNLQKYVLCVQSV